MARFRRPWLAVIGALALGVLMAAPAAASAGGDPPGNNGTIKIDGQPFDNAPDNEPHPGCVFQVDFYGFDAGNLNADLTFEAVAPTAGGVLLTDTVPIGEDSHAGGGSEAGLDASKTYDLTSALTGIEPQRNQGWHVRLTVHADGSQGSDVKHKVFWVDGCTTAAAATAPASGDTTSGTASDTTGGGGDVGHEAASPAVGASPMAPGTAPASVLAAELAAAAPSASPVAATAPPAAPAAFTESAQVLGESVSRAPSSASGALGASSLARTGMGLGLAVLAFALVAAGVALRRIGTLRLPPMRS